MDASLTVTIATAIASGAAVALKDTASRAIKDAYNAVKTLITNKYKNVDADQIEKAPDSKSRQNVLTDELHAAGAEHDTDLRDLVTKLLQAIEDDPESSAQPVGVRVADLKVKLLEIEQVDEGAGVETDKADIETLRIKQVGKKKG